MSFRIRNDFDKENDMDSPRVPWGSGRAPHKRKRWQQVCENNGPTQ